MAIVAFPEGLIQGKISTLVVISLAVLYKVGKGGQKCEDKREKTIYCRGGMP
ncbi:hypothetical protein [Thalassomonas actiniarum]|uniref:hypothetical protein n=1 Tax=Thalassomonas actiniarum TaxID=485447 RepID=UPI002361C4C6|nr:hypothetical protein [Thalassomonas actiniarum]